MKRLIAALVLSVPFLAQAQQKINLPLVCGDFDFIGKVLKEYKEEILFIGKDDIHKVEGVTVNVFLNAKTGTYSIVLIEAKSGMVCVMSSGQNGKLIYSN